MNKYVWDLYLKSGGQEVVDFFEDNFVNGLKDEYADKINEFQRVYCVFKDRIRWTSEELREYVSINKEIKEDFIIEEDNDEKLDDVSEHLNAIDEAIINLWTEYSKKGKNDKLKIKLIEVKTLEEAINKIHPTYQFHGFYI